MNNTNLDPDLIAFIASLSRLNKILAEYEQGFLARKISKVQRIAENSDGHCVALFLGLYGGMGSFNDLVLNAPPAVNEMLDKERTHAYNLAQALR